MQEAEQHRRTYARAVSLIGQGGANLNEALALLMGLLPSVRDVRQRALINKRTWDVARALGRYPAFFSEAGQDAWLAANIFKGKQGGTFVEIGGYDGVTGSNCLHFEMMCGWRGVIVEASPTYHARAAAVRRSPCLRLAVSDQEGEAEFLQVEAGLTQMGRLLAAGGREVIEADPKHRGAVVRVPTRPLASILRDQGMQSVDFISLDVEGFEQRILSVFPFGEFDVGAWCIENPQGRALHDLMAANGYNRLAEAMGPDEIYVKAGAG
jgi:FkbM family methyltransferase